MKYRIPRTNSEIFYEEEDDDIYITNFTGEIKDMLFIDGVQEALIKYILSKKKIDAEYKSYFSK